MDKDTHPDLPVLGELTLSDLSDTSAFCSAPVTDAWGVDRLPFSAQVARMSAELAANGYELDIKPWRNAGWEDCTFVIEGRVINLDREDGSRLAALEGEWKRRRAKTLIRGVNPVSDLLRAARQLLVTDMGKTIVMTRRAQDGRMIVAVSFVGTTQKYFDWFSNFKFQQEGGIHYGFLELARRFEAQATRILLPKLAAQLGEETFSLADVLLEAEKKDSRFVLWVSGHSQGGALAQTFARQLLVKGVPCDAIHAYTFAAPTVAACDGSIDPKEYPLYNIINADDLVPRVGAQVRLGQDLIFWPDDAFRAQYYRVEKEQWEAFKRSLYLSSQVQSMQDGVCWLIAFIRLLLSYETGEGDNPLAELMPFQPLLKRMNLSLDEVAEFMQGKLANQYRELTGSLPDEALCGHYEDSMRRLIEATSAKTFGKTLTESLMAPHRLRPDKHDEGFESPYIAIVRRRLNRCVRGVWARDAPARCLSAQGVQLLPGYRMPIEGMGEAQPKLPEGAADAALPPPIPAPPEDHSS